MVRLKTLLGAVHNIVDEHFKHGTQSMLTRVTHGFLTLSRANQFKEQLKMHTEQLKHTDLQICLHVCSLKSPEEESAAIRCMFEDTLAAAASAKPVCEQEQELSGGGARP